MTVFTALVPSAAAVAHLEAAVAPVRAAEPGLRWVRPERWHTTVLFLGDVADDAVPALATATGAAVADVAAPTVRLRGAGAFPRGRKPLRVLWVGVEGPLGPLVAACTAAARACGVALERRDSVPHLTLARAPRRPAGDPVAPLASYAGPEHTVDALHLLRSRPGRPGPYEVVARLTLGGGDVA